MPEGAIALLPGHGEVGAALVRHPGVHVIAFTGSSAVGQEIVREARARRATARRHLKRVVAEMGGKNCVIVDSDADLDEAVPGIVRSAFVYAGQKCSAASRVLAHEQVAERARRAAGRCRRAAARRSGRRARHRRAAGDRCRGAAAGARLRRAGATRRASCSRRREVPEGPGWFCAPTLVGRARPLLTGAARRGLRPAAGARAGGRRSTPPATPSRAAVRAHRRPLLPRPGDDRRGRPAAAGRQPLHQPAHDRRDGRPPAVRRQPALRQRARRPAGPTTCSTSSSRAWLPRTRPATGSSWNKRRRPLRRVQSRMCHTPA